jgi:hypothetical protein
MVMIIQATFLVEIVYTDAKKKKGHGKIISDEGLIPVIGSL